MSGNRSSSKPPWNKGKLVGQKPPLKIKEVWGIRVRLQLAGRHRDLALFNLAIDSKLRGCDVVRVGIEDVLLSGSVRSRAAVVQQKTGKPVTFEITDQTKVALQQWLRHAGSRQRGALFPSPIDPKRSISTRQYARLVGTWVKSIGLDSTCYGTHPLRRTKATPIYIGELAISARCSCYSDTQNWRAPSGTSELK
jgi:integrase